MKFLRQILVKLVGLKGYYILASKVNISLMTSGFLKKKYPELFYLRKIIKQGFVCVDIGANVGYYSIFMSRFSGREGRVLSIEPVQWLSDILKLNLQSARTNNVRVFPQSFEEEDNDIFKIPGEVAALTRLDFIKCSANGSEYRVLLDMKDVVTKLKPLIQSGQGNIETKKLLYDFFNSMNYKVCKLNREQLTYMTEKEFYSYDADVYFVPSNPVSH